MNDQLGTVDYVSEAIEVQPNSVLSIVLIQSTKSMLWFLFEGMLNLKTGEFEVPVPIQKFKYNTRDLKRPPSQALKMAVQCAMVRKLPIWIPYWGLSGM